MAPAVTGTWFPAKTTKGLDGKYPFLLLLGQNFQKCREALQTQNPPRPTKIKKLSETSATSNTSRVPEVGSGTAFFRATAVWWQKNRSARRSSGSNKVLWPWRRRSNNGIGIVDFWQESWNCPFLQGYETMQICGHFEEFWLNRILNSLGWQCNEFCFIHFYPTSNFKKILVSTSVHQSTFSFIRHTTMLSSQAPADGIFECWLPYPPRSGTSAELERLDQKVTESETNSKRPWKYNVLAPKGKDHLPVTLLHPFLRGELLNFRGVRSKWWFIHRDIWCFHPGKIHQTWNFQTKEFRF